MEGTSPIGVASVYVKAIYVKSEQPLNDASNAITRMGERTGHTWLGDDI